MGIKGLIWSTPYLNTRTLFFLFLVSQNCCENFLLKDFAIKCPMKSSGVVFPSDVSAAAQRAAETLQKNLSISLRFKSASLE